MPTPSPALFQGRDWSTSRDFVAEAFITLDLMSDFCVCQGPCDITEQETPPMPLIPSLIRLCDKLKGEIDLASANTIYSQQTSCDFSQKWAFFEMHSTLKEMIEKIISLSGKESTKKTSHLLPLIKQIKTVLKRLDQ